MFYSPIADHTTRVVDSQYQHVGRSHGNKSGTSLRSSMQQLRYYCWPLNRHRRAGQNNYFTDQLHDNKSMCLNLSDVSIPITHVCVLTLIKGDHTGEWRWQNAHPKTVKLTVSETFLKNTCLTFEMCGAFSSGSVVHMVKFVSFWMPC